MQACCFVTDFALACFFCCAIHLTQRRKGAKKRQGFDLCTFASLRLCVKYSRSDCSTNPLYLSVFISGQSSFSQANKTLIKAPNRKSKIKNRISIPSPRSADGRRPFGHQVRQGRAHRLVGFNQQVIKPKPPSRFADLLLVFCQRF